MSSADLLAKGPTRTIRLALAAGLALAGVWLLVSGRVARTPEAPEARARRLSTAYGIEIGFGAPDSFFVAPYGPSDARLPSVQAGATDAASAATALEGIERALEQYPSGFVAGLIKAIFIAGELRIEGAKAGGTVGPAWIILAAPARLGEEGILATAYIGVHHELSSFVLRRQPSTLSAWQRFEPADWKFDANTGSVIARSQDADPDPDTGFLSAYGGTNPENDFNVYAEKIFTEPQKVAKLARDHALIRKKLDFVLATYEQIDPRLAAVFSQLGVK